MPCCNLDDVAVECRQGHGSKLDRKQARDGVVSHYPAVSEIFDAWIAFTNVRITPFVRPVGSGVHIYLVADVQQSGKLILQMVQVFVSAIKIVSIEELGSGDSDDSIVCQVPCYLSVDSRTRFEDEDDKPAGVALVARSVPDVCCNAAKSWDSTSLIEPTRICTSRAFAADTHLVDPFARFCDGQPLSGFSMNSAQALHIQDAGRGQSDLASCYVQKRGSATTRITVSGKRLLTVAPELW